jgi:hypothetical protein
MERAIVKVNIGNDSRFDFRRVLLWIPPKMQQEAQRRMIAARKARRSPKAGTVLQQRASLVGHGAKWRITNFKQVVRAMAKRA